ncbi:MAG: hypothetical protein WCH62_07520, partial [Candidatus Omnitrophota bacterium]
HNVQEAVLDADVVIIAVEWPEFLRFDEDVINLMRNKIIIDPNGFLAKIVEHKDLNYISVGKSLDKRMSQ